MSLEKAREFFKSIEVGGQAQEEFKALVMESKGLSKEEAMEKVIRFANGKGFEISPEDMNSLAAEVNNRELSDEELDTVAGAGYVTWTLIYQGMSDGTKGSACLLVGGGW